MFNLYFLNLRERISSSQSSQNNKKGFTLIKMLIVIAIIAILAAIVIIAINLVKQMQKPSPISMRQSTGEGGKANGQICSIGSECNSGNCVTGYCCSSPSCNTCYSCPTGSCAAQTCDGAAATLLGCTQGSEACRYCNAGTCGYYTSDQHGCPSGQTCNSSGQCADEGGGGGGGGGGKANGQACSTGSECSSGNCVTGYCCSSPSCNTCYSCSTGSCAAQTCDGAAATLLGCTQGSEACRYCNAGTCGYYTSGQHGCSSGQTCNSSGQCAQQYALSVSKTGTGSGTVTSNPSGINCGSTCQYSFNSGTSVTLTASAEGGSVFTGWSGEGCSGTGTCIVSMTQARLVTANFMLCGGYAWGGYCWYKGESLQNCNTVCQGHGATCVLDGKTGTDANDNSNCDLCHHWEPGFTCIETSYGGEPQIEYSDSRCRRRPLTQAGNCSFTNDSYGRRICACSY